MRLDEEVLATWGKLRRAQAISKAKQEFGDARTRKAASGTMHQQLHPAQHKGTCRQATHTPVKLRALAQTRARPPAAAVSLAPVCNARSPALSYLQAATCTTSSCKPATGTHGSGQGALQEQLTPQLEQPLPNAAVWHVQSTLTAEPWSAAPAWQGIPWVQQTAMSGPSTPDSTSTSPKQGLTWLSPLQHRPSDTNMPPPSAMPEQQPCLPYSSSTSTVNTNNAGARHMGDCTVALAGGSTTCIARASPRSEGRFEQQSHAPWQQQAPDSINWHGTQSSASLAMPLSWRAAAEQVYNSDGPPDESYRSMAHICMPLTDSPHSRSSSCSAGSEQHAWRVQAFSKQPRTATQIPAAAMQHAFGDTRKAKHNFKTMSPPSGSAHLDGPLLFQQPYPMYPIPPLERRYSSQGGSSYTSSINDGGSEAMPLSQHSQDSRAAPHPTALDADSALIGINQQHTNPGTGDRYSATAMNTVPLRRDSRLHLERARALMRNGSTVQVAAEQQQQQQQHISCSPNTQACANARQSDATTQHLLNDASREWVSGPQQTDGDGTAVMPKALFSCASGFEDDGAAYLCSVGLSTVPLQSAELVVFAGDQSALLYPNRNSTLQVIAVGQTCTGTSRDMDLPSSAATRATHSTGSSSGSHSMQVLHPFWAQHVAGTQAAAEQQTDSTAMVALCATAVGQGGPTTFSILQHPVQQMPAGAATPEPGAPNITLTEVTGLAPQAPCISMSALNAADPWPSSGAAGAGETNTIGCKNYSPGANTQWMLQPESAGSLGIDPKQHTSHGSVSAAHTASEPGRARQAQPAWRTAVDDGAEAVVPLESWCHTEGWESEADDVTASLEHVVHSYLRSSLAKT